MVPVTGSYIYKIGFMYKSVLQLQDNDLLSSAFVKEVRESGCNCKLTLLNVYWTLEARKPDFDRQNDKCAHGQ